jgi:hypothetical protein
MGKRTAELTYDDADNVGINGATASIAGGVRKIDPQTCNYT